MDETHEANDTNGMDDRDDMGDRHTDADDGSYTAVLDRIEAGSDEELAVLVLERDGRAVGDLVVALDALPAEGRAADTVLEVVVEDGKLVAATVDAEETANRRDRAQSRFRRLARRLPREERAVDETDGTDGSDDETDETDGSDDAHTE